MGFQLVASKRRWQLKIASIVAAALYAAQTQPCVAQAALQELPPPEAIKPLGDPLQFEAGLIESLDADPSVAAPLPEKLTVADVVASVYRFYPEINQARQQARLADGELLSAYGEFDHKLKAFTLSEPTGFYENYRHGIGVARQTWWGGQVAAGYRIGRGQFQPWYLERETEKGGEFKLAWIQPLLQGRAIDPQRFGVFQASLARRAADPILQEAILNTSRDALLAYWNWVAAGATLEAQNGLLELAESRGEQFQVGFKAGKFAEIDVIINDQQIAERRATAINADRKFRTAALKLALFLRDDAGQPLMPADDWLPAAFPRIGPLPETNIDDEIRLAVQRRPEPRILQIELRQLDLDRRLARNQRLPQLDFVVEGSKDVGAPGSKSDDKGPFVLVIGAASEVPIQRRKARGKLQATAAKIAQVTEKLRLQQDKIGIELRTALANLTFSAQVVAQAELSFEAAIETLSRFEFAFEKGKIDLIYLNLIETKTNETQLKLIDAQQAWFEELARYQAAAGLDPLDQANLVTALPDSDLPRRDAIDQPNEQQFNQDWQRRKGLSAE